MLRVGHESNGAKVIITLNDMCASFIDVGHGWAAFGRVPPRALWDAPSLDALTLADAAYTSFHKASAGQGNVHSLVCHLEGFLARG